ncbi:hypothetical protein BJY01DRAFT_208606 [Aspergillus pseudoustus]|uniref:RING-type domain-containing protein n=1 Tax=Aspergillus pseudoustus TaxID=1810923 RepID=A0ABR4KI87_9EURO
MADAGSEDRVTCHACGQVWPRISEHGLECPYCGSEFTEIIEIPPDTDPDPDYEPSHPDPPETFPGYHRSPPPPPVNPFADHNPWAFNDDDTHGWDQGPRVTHRTFQSPNGSYIFHGSIRTHGFPPRRVSGAQRDRDFDPIMREMGQIFQNLHEVDRERASRAQGPGSPRADHTTFTFTNRPMHHPQGGLFPRDADGPQPMGSPLGSLGNLLELLQSAQQPQQPGAPNVRIMGGAAPLALISALLNIGRNGDAVYSQEELDRVISQLVEQNNHSAVPPAAQDAIQALPKKAADAEILGSEGKAECSICMDSVKIGDEVTVLPCTHWFHPQCIEMWLNQHNTCPHCRRGIDPNMTTDAANTAPSEGTYASAQTRRSDSISGSSTHQSHTSEEDRGSRSSRGEGSGGWTGWVRNRLGGG